MRKSIFFSLLCLIAIVAVACGGGNNATGNGTGGGDAASCGGGNGGGGEISAQEQWDNLYKEGASWIVKMDFGTPMWQKTEVKSVADGVAKIETSTKMSEDGEFANPAPSEVKRPAEGGTAETPEGYKELGKGEEKVGDWDCTWVESESNGTKTKTWMSKKYGAVVKMEQGGKVTMELVELNAK